jgi:hypothetical protein
MRGPFRESELAETPPHRAEIWFSSVPCGPLPASGPRKAGVPAPTSAGVHFAHSPTLVACAARAKRAFGWVTRIPPGFVPQTGW